MKTFSIVLTILFLIILGIYLILVYKRNTKKNIYCLITNLITLIETFIFTKLVIGLLEDKLITSMSSLIKNSLQISKEEWIKDSSINLVTELLSTIVIGLISFLIIFIILYILNHVLKRIIFKKINNKTYKEYKSMDNNKIINIVGGFCSFYIVTFALFYPVGAIFKIFIDSTHTVNFNTPIEIKPIINNPVIRLYAYKGSEIFFDQITKMPDNNIKNSKELQSITTITLALVDMENSSDINQNILAIKEEFNNTTLTPLFISEFCSNAANRWKNNQSFMGKSITIPNDDSQEIYLDLLDIMSKWEKDDVIEDLNTIFDFYSILDEYKVLESDDSEALINALTNEKFDEEIFVCLFENADFKNVLAAFLDFGIKSIFKELDIDVEVNYVDIGKMMEMSDEEIKNEARIFAKTVKKLVEIENVIEKGVTNEEYQELLKDLEEVSDSEILNTSVDKVIKKLLANI